MYECKRLYQPIECSWTDRDKGLIRIKNRHSSTSTSKYNISLEVLENGKAILEEEIPTINLNAGKDTSVSIKKYLPKLKDGPEYLLNILFTLKESESWAEKGFEVASNQLALSGLANKAKNTDPELPVKLTEEDSTYLVQGTNFNIKFSKNSGALISCSTKQGEFIKHAFLPHFTRPLTDNDKRGWKPQKKLKDWYDAIPQLDRMETKQINGNSISIISYYTIIKNKAEVLLKYTIIGNGSVKVDYHLNIKDSLPNIPKIGMLGGINSSFDQITWYGRGLYENYIDRNYGFDAGICSLPIDKFMEPYIYPQENGNRTDVRWMYLSDENEGLLVVADSLLSINAWPYTEDMINQAKHTNELKDAGYITLNIDLIQMGIGGNDSWSQVAAPLEKYQVPAKNYAYSFYLVPITVEPEGVYKEAFEVRF